MSNEFQGQDGQRVGDAVKLQVGGAIKGQGFVCEQINQAISSVAVADAINKAEFGFYLVYKTRSINVLGEADDSVKLPSLIADGDSTGDATPRIEGVLFRDGEYFAVAGHRVDALHKAGIEHGDFSVVGYINKYLLSVFHQVQGNEKEVTA
jgi:hypothetical protein